MTAVWDNFIGPLQMSNRYYSNKKPSQNFISETVKLVKMLHYFFIARKPL